MHDFGERVANGNPAVILNLREVLNLVDSAGLR